MPSHTKEGTGTDLMLDFVFGGPKWICASHIDERLGHADALTPEIDPRPPKSEELPETEATEASDEHERSISRVHRIGESPQLLRSEEVHLLVLDLRQRQLRNGVVWDQPILERSVDGLVEDLHDLVDRRPARGWRRGESPSRASHERSEVRSSLLSGVSLNAGRMCDL